MAEPSVTVPRLQPSVRVLVLENFGVGKIKYKTPCLLPNARNVILVNCEYTKKFKSLLNSLLGPNVAFLTLHERPGSRAPISEPDGLLKMLKSIMPRLRHLCLAPSSPLGKIDVQALSRYRSLRTLRYDHPKASNGMYDHIVKEFPSTLMILEVYRIPCIPLVMHLLRQLATREYLPYLRYIPQITFEAVLAAPLHGGAEPVEEDLSAALEAVEVQRIITEQALLKRGLQKRSNWLVKVHPEVPA